MRQCRASFALLLIVVSIQAQPKRIVSTLPSATETLFALGLGERVVGVSTYCRYPPAVLSLPKIGTYMQPDPEKIALLRPDLVIVEKEATSIKDRLSALGIRYTPVKVNSLPEIYVMIQDIGSAAGVPQKARDLNQQIRSRLEAISTQDPGSRRPNVLMVVGRTPGLLTNLIAVGPSTYLSELLSLAGGTNVISATAIPYPHISLETVERSDPDVILDLSMMGEAAQPRAQEERLRQPWLVHRELKAVAHDDVFGVASETLVTPGPRVPEAVMELRERIQAAVAHEAVR